MENALVSKCFYGIPCRYHGLSVASPLKINRLSKKYHLVSVCPEELGGLLTPRSPAPLKNKQGKTIKDVNGKDLSVFFLRGAEKTLAIAVYHGCKKAFLCKNSPSCDRRGFAGELLINNGIQVINL